MAVKDNENPWGRGVVPKKKRGWPGVAVAAAAAAAVEGSDAPTKRRKVEAPTRSWPYGQAPYFTEDQLAKFHCLVEVAVRARQGRGREERGGQEDEEEKIGGSIAAEEGEEKTGGTAAAEEEEGSGEDRGGVTGGAEGEAGGGRGRRVPDSDGQAADEDGHDG